MCGIAGLAGDFTSAEGLGVVATMNAALIHRGPDDEGSWACDGFAFAMRRLSIIDLSGGHQPMRTGDGLGIVFNGEIYNYRALRDELVRSGYAFETNSDTEVTLKLFHRDGLAAIRRLEGMFAICIHDPGPRRLFLARDRLGKKPLYYGRLGGRFFFASELKAILAACGARPPVNLQAVHHYLTLRYVPGPDTIWSGIRKLEPACTLTLDLDSGTETVDRYWSAPFFARPLEEGRDYVREFETRFLPAVEKRLVASDVPVGTLLSGGLDSSAVSAAAIELGHRDLHTFSVSFGDGGDFDETGYAREVAGQTGSRHHEVVIGQKEFLEFLPQLPYWTDEPLADLASIPLFYVCRLAHSEVKVVLSGEGGDEIFAGYSLDRLAVTLRHLARLARLAPPPLLRAAAAIAPHARARRVLRDLAASGIGGFLGAQVRHMSYYWNEREKAELWRGSPPLDSTDGLIRSWYRECASGEPVDQIQQVMVRSWLVEDLLMKADRMSMANSLELRVPFLDHHLVEWASSLPLAWRVGDSSSGPVSKRVVREFCRRRLPERILERPKQGFPVPAYRWLANGLGGWAEQLLLGGRARLAEWLDLERARPILAAARAGDELAAHKTWALIVLEHWMRRWL
jgi:asparagine synthase (glutamine-hydrolysing)